MKKFKTEEEILTEETLKGIIQEIIEKLIKDGIIDLNRKPSMMIILPVILKSDDYVKDNDGEYADQLDNFAVKVAMTKYRTQYGYDDTFVTEATNDAAYNRYIYGKREAALQFPKSWTDKRNEARSGKGITVSAFPTGPDVSTPPTQVLPGSEDRFRLKAQSLKDNKVKTTDAAEEDMGISTPHTGTDTSTARPALTHTFVSGGHPMIHYTRGIFQGIELMVDRGDGHGMVLLDKISNHKYTDNGTLPAAGVSAVWKYQAIFRLNDGRIGIWSNIISVTVTGV